MMKDFLKIETIVSAMHKAGISQAELAAHLGVSRTIVSEWLNDRKRPRPRHLLALSRVLGLSFEDVIEQNTVAEPVVAYRKLGHAKHTKEDDERAMDMARALERLSPYLPYGRLSSPSRFIEPKTDPAFIEEAADETRKRIDAFRLGRCGAYARISDLTELYFGEIVDLFAEVKAILIPVLWGPKDRKGNALHIYLPSSQTTWIYFNLDVKVFDVKFWMLHEYAHAKTCGAFSVDVAEEFSDLFAGAVLFSKNEATEAYRELSAICNEGLRIKRIIEIAETCFISPITVAKRIDLTAIARGDEPLKIPVFPATTNLNKCFESFASMLFGSAESSADSFITISEGHFKSPFFSAVRAYLKDNPYDSFLSTVLGIPRGDAKELFLKLYNG